MDSGRKDKTMRMMPNLLTTGKCVRAALWRADKFPFVTTYYCNAQNPSLDQRRLEHKVANKRDSFSYRLYWIEFRCDPNMLY